MQPSPLSTRALPSATSSQATHYRRSDDLAYQAVTVAAMLMLLCGLCAF
jgi:hypothetical protein